MRLLRLLAAARHSLPRVLPLMRDVRVPLWLKISAVALAVAILSPLDLFGDIPVLGLFDDAALLMLLASGFVMVSQRFIDRLVVVRHEPPRRVTALSLPR